MTTLRPGPVIRLALAVASTGIQRKGEAERNQVSWLSPPDRQSQGLSEGLSEEPGCGSQDHWGSVG